MDQFEPERELESAMLAARSDPKREPEFFQALFDSEVLVPLPGPAPVEDKLYSAGPGSEIDLPVLEGEGRSVVPVFSSMEQLLRFVPAGTGYMRIRVADLVKIWPDDVWMAINLKGTIGTALAPAQVKTLPNPEAARASGTGYVLGHPKDEPEGLIMTLRAFAERTPDVVELYRALMLVRGTGDPARIAIGVEVASGADKDEIFRALTEAGRESGVDAFLLTPVDRNDPNDVAKWMLDNDASFYRRKDA